MQVLYRQDLSKVWSFYLTKGKKKLGERKKLVPAEPAQTHHPEDKR